MRRALHEAAQFPHRSLLASNSVGLAWSSPCGASRLRERCLWLQKEPAKSQLRCLVALRGATQKQIHRGAWLDMHHPYFRNYNCRHRMGSDGKLHKDRNNQRRRRRAKGFKPDQPQTVGERKASLSGYAEGTRIHSGC
jgi:hypothetical protein